MRRGVTSETRGLYGQEMIAEAGRLSSRVGTGLPQEREHQLLRSSMAEESHGCCGRWEGKCRLK